MAQQTHTWPHVLPVCGELPNLLGSGKVELVPPPDSLFHEAVYESTLLKVAASHVGSLFNSPLLKRPSR